MSQSVSLCTIPRFSGLMGELGLTLPWRPFRQARDVCRSFFEFRSRSSHFVPSWADERTEAKDGGLNDNVREASQGLTRGRCHWARAAAESLADTLSEAGCRSREAEILRCVRNDKHIWRLCNRPTSTTTTVYLARPFLRQICIWRNMAPTIQPRVIGEHIGRINWPFLKTVVVVLVVQQR